MTMLTSQSWLQTIPNMSQCSCESWKWPWKTHETTNNLKQPIKGVRCRLVLASPFEAKIYWLISTVIWRILERQTMNPPHTPFQSLAPCLIRLIMAKRHLKVLKGKNHKVTSIFQSPVDLIWYILMETATNTIRNIFDLQRAADCLWTTMKQSQHHQALSTKSPDQFLWSSQINENIFCCFCWLYIIYACSCGWSPYLLLQSYDFFHRFQPISSPWLRLRGLYQSLIWQ